MLVLGCGCLWNSCIVSLTQYLYIQQSFQFFFHIKQLLPTVSLFIQKHYRRILTLQRFTNLICELLQRLDGVWLSSASAANAKAASTTSSRATIAPCSV